MSDTCPICDTPVGVEGATCSIDCYTHLWLLIDQGKHPFRGYLLDLESQPWYPGEADREEQL